MLTPGTVLLHDTVDPAGQNLLFQHPRQTIVAHTPAQARQALALLRQAQRDGLWAAGYLAYELGYLFEDRLAHRLPERSATPLLWLGLYDPPQHLTRTAALDWLDGQDPGEPGSVTAITPRAAGYAAAFAAIQNFIAAGDVYQVNLTFKASFALQGSAVGLYRDLVRKQAVRYGALIQTETNTILSRSPELFVANRAGRLTARPMKGTRRRGTSLADDNSARTALRADPKNRAENLMITDLLRNDLGRISQIGSVEVTDLFAVETYRTLHTLTSGITARLKPGLDGVDVLENLFPCGSITGAPKLRAMQIIADHETEPRGVYTGAIGYFDPDGNLCLSVAIRTAVIDAHGQGEVGVGGGIVADSTLTSEYEEALLKMRFLSDPAIPVALIETLRWTPGEGFYLLDRHLDRLEQSARYFGLACDRASLATLLHGHVAGATGPTRVRLLLEETGPSVSSVPLAPNPDVFRFSIAPDRLASDSVWLAHKTTHRSFYDAPRQAAAAALGVDEVLFLNEREEVTEGSITNIFVERDGVLLTPPLSAGLLPGTLRAEFLATGRAREAQLTLADLATAQTIYLGNSVRGLMRAQWVKPA